MQVKDARITFLVNQDGAEISITDNDASVTFLKVTLTPEQLCKAMSRLSFTPCSAEVFGLDKVGKHMETKDFDFEIPAEISGRKHIDSLKVEAINALSKAGLLDWTPDEYYGSQNSFFEKGDKQYARVSIRRWV